MRALVAILGAFALVSAGCGKTLAPPLATNAEVQARSRADASHAFAALFSVYERALLVAEPLRLQNVSRCGDKVGGYLGWIAFADRDFGSTQMRDLAAEVVRVGKSPVVVALSPAAPAALAGVQIGDQIDSIDGKRVWTTEQVSRAERKLSAGKTPVSITRGGTGLVLEVEPARACAYDVVPVPSPGLDAATRGSNIWVTLTLVDLANNDELAFVIAHAMARSLLGVDPERVTELVPEPEATELAVALSEQAGFSVDGVERVLELRAIEEPWTVIGTHNPLANPFWRPKGDVMIGESARRIVALRAIRAGRESAPAR